MQVQFKTKNKFQIKYLIVLLILLTYQGIINAQVVSTWAVGDGEKILRDEINHPLKKKNFVWDGNTIRMKGLYNEILAFQLIIETGNSGVSGIEIAVENPVNNQTGSIIGGNTLKYGKSGTIEIFSQHYLYVPENRSSPPSWFYGSPNSAPKKMVGWIPDALIPVNVQNSNKTQYSGLDPQGFGENDNLKANSGGLPMNIGANRNQGFWVDIHLPRDNQRFPPGIYKGEIQIIEKGNIVNQIPVEITLLPEFLPDENRTNIWLFTSDVYPYFEGLNKEEVDKLIKFEGHRHRIDVTGGFSVNNSTFSNESMNRYKQWLDGSAYTVANGYWGPGQGVGEKYFPIGMYGSNVLGNTKKELQLQSDLWVNWFQKNAPNIRYFWYITDEPPVERYPWIKERTQWIKSNSGPGKNLPVFTTRGYQKELEGSIDIWSAYNGVKLDDLPQVRNNGGDYFFYNGLRPHNGTTILEGAAVDFRINSWLLYKYDIDCHFIWHGTHWKHNHQGPKGNFHQNVFQSPITFSEFGNNDFGNGAGIIFYPGRMPFYPEEDRGINSLLPSIRLKNIRRGQQDAILMSLAEEKIGKQNVVKILDKVIPKALSEVDKNDPVPWSENGDDYDKVRDLLLNIIIK